MKKKSTRYSPEAMERAVRLVFESREQYESQWAAIESIAGKIGCTAETLRRWVRQQERDTETENGVRSCNREERGQVLQSNIQNGEYLNQATP